MTAAPRSTAAKPAANTIVVKVGSSSITGDDGRIVEAAIAKLCCEVAELRREGHNVVIVTSGAIAAGLQVLELYPRPVDPAVLQAISAVGQSRLMSHYERALGSCGLVGGQVLLAALDFVNRAQYLHARQTLWLLLSLGVVPVVNENDAVTDDEIRFGDNDRLAALVAHLVQAELLVLLTDAAGLLTADPRTDEKASLIEEVVEVDHVLGFAGGAGTERGSGGMASKLAAAKIAAWSGVRVVIASADRPGVLQDAVVGAPGAGTFVRARQVRLPARKLWIAFALAPAGTLVVDAGAKKALLEKNVSLLAAGVQEVRGDFLADEAVEVAGPDGGVFAKGIARHNAKDVSAWMGLKSSLLPPDVPHEIVHRDDLVILP